MLVYQRVVSGLVHPNDKWIKPTYSMYNWGYIPLINWDEPPSIHPKLAILNWKMLMFHHIEGYHIRRQTQ